MLLVERSYGTLHVIYFTVISIRTQLRSEAGVVSMWLFVRRVYVYVGVSCVSPASQPADTGNVPSTSSARRTDEFQSSIMRETIPSWVL